MDLTETQDGGVLKEILREGTSNEKPSTGDKVTVHYVGTLLDGSQFDSSRDRGEKFTFTLGKGQVIKAWDLGVASMCKGELAKLTCKAEYAYGENGSPPKIPPNATLVFEVELFSWQGEDITKDKDNGIIRSILQKGKGGGCPNDYARVTIKYQILYDGKVVLNETEASFDLGASEDPNVSSGLEMALRKMNQSERSRLTMKPEYGFGKDGNKELGIPGGADIVYEVELVSFEKAKYNYEMDTSEKLDQADIRKAKGTDFFKKGLMQKALNNYNTILDYLDSETTLEGDEKDRRDALVLAARLNLAACSLQLGDNSGAIDNCNEALNIKENPKAYFRRAQAQQNRKEYKQAVSDYERVLSLEPDNKAARNQIVVCKRKEQEDYQKEKKLYANMFSKITQPTAKKTPDPPVGDGVFKDGIGEWSNDMAAGMMPLEEEVAAFGDVMPVEQTGNNNGNNHRFL